MIKVETKMGDTKVTIVGGLPTICADSVQIIRSIYNSVSERNEELGEEYKKAMSKDLCRLAFEGLNENDENFMNAMNALKALKELLNIIKNEEEEEENEND